MPKRMLIDASHPEETRVVILDGSKVEEFDFEAASKRPLKGNIYLAKVTRVEPSLQAAFVEYGGNRQGFLAFSEIHPDYYQIPVADRMALLADQSRRLMAEDDEAFKSVKTAKPSKKTAPAKSEASSDEDDNDDAEASDGEAEDGEFAEGVEAASDEDPDDRDRDEDDGEKAEASPASDDEISEPAESASATETPDEDERLSVEPEAATVRAEATGAPIPHQRREHRQRPPRRRQYKIQEVIKRRQVMLVQVVKEERGNKGASLTTFLSLAGRYCVLMPNTPRGGGISRKITSATDRRRLKSAAQSLELAEGMGLIIRTAGANRTKVEIKRDYEYLLRLWDSVRELTLKSNAPALVYEEGNLVKRVIRDLYNKDISEVLVDGEGGYRDAKDFMRMLMPSHAKNVKPYKEPLPLFQRFGVEAQLDAMFSPTVTLRSGGYIVINQTEALVSVDVNSGKATREHNIEDTAYKTNCEAADEIGRQLRLRDLAGLIVIDFIDMEDGKNDRAVEKRLRDAVRNDRARVQIGKISQFGLLEMSRQRLRAGVVAGSTVTCPHCAGVGLVRSTESAALRLLRALDEEGQRQRGANFSVRAPEDVVIYTLNQKRREVARIEDAYELVIVFEPKLGIAGGSFEIERTGMRAVAQVVPKSTAVSLDGGFAREQAVEEAPDVTLVEAPAPAQAAPRDSDASPAHQHPHQQQGEGRGDGKRKRRRRRRGGRGRDRGPIETGAVPPAADDAAVALNDQSDEEAEDEATEAGTETFETAEGTQPAPTQGEDDSQRQRQRRRRGRRGRRRDGEGSTPGVALDVRSDDAALAAPSDRLDGAAETGQLPGAGASEEDVPASIAAFGVAPNAPSSPQWSLAAEEPAIIAPPANEARPRSRPRTAVEAAPEVEDPGPRSPEPERPQPAPRAKRAAWRLVATPV